MDSKTIKNLWFEESIDACTYDFLETSKITFYNIDDFVARTNLVMEENYYKEAILNHKPNPHSLKSIQLESSPETEVFENILSKRKSVRQYNRFITLKELGAWLKSSYFLRDDIQDKYSNVKRSIPSAGGLFPIDVYYLNLNTEHLAKGVYYYNWSNTSLELLKNEDILAEIKPIFLQAEGASIWDIEQASGIVILVGNTKRITFKYGDRGIRFMLMEAGLICQNLSLSASLLNIGCFANGGFLDDDLNDFLSLNKLEYALLSMVVGGN